VISTHLREHTKMFSPSKPTGNGASTASLLETKKKERKKRAEWLKMVHAEILEKQKIMLEVYGPARAKGITTVTINTFCVGLSWLNRKCYNYYV
jgi:hypothetical protein